MIQMKETHRVGRCLIIDAIAYGLGNVIGESGDGAVDCIGNGVLIT